MAIALKQTFSTSFYFDWMQVDPSGVRYNGRRDVVTFYYRNMRVTTERWGYLGPYTSSYFQMRFGAIYICHNIQLVNPDRVILVEMNIQR